MSDTRRSDLVAALNAVSVISPKVSYGLGSIAGIVAAGGQYAGAVASALSSGESSSVTIALVTTATVTLVTTIGGRMAQAATALKAAGTVAASATTLPLEPVRSYVGTTENRVSAGYEHMHGAKMPRPEPDDKEPEPEPGLELDPLPDRPEPGPDEADGDEALEPDYPGRDGTVERRLEVERQGDGCAVTTSGKKDRP